VVRGLRYRDAAGVHELRAALVVAADGRRSVLRDAAGLRPVSSSPPMDVLWLRVSRLPSDPDSVFAQLGSGDFVVLLNRGSYWQMGYVIPKGEDARVRAAGLPALRARIAELAPVVAGRVGEIDSWDGVHLLTVEANRLRRWHRPGLLCIGDAAHAMSPVGGVGINLAVQDAVAAANLLAGPLAAGTVTDARLAAVQRRRELPTRIIQAFQGQMQKMVLGPALRGEGGIASVPRIVRMLGRIPLLRDLPVRLIALGVRRSHVDG
jgi:2-polyprenyl-6-methoxyphenol hydroxylase-like FAD-dependent oxidoreductase